jgi:alpha-glucosidase
MPTSTLGCAGRAAALLMLALPGSAYVYQGGELGLPEVEDIPDDRLQDPIFVQSGGAERGRDGCRVPLPWSGDRPPYGFGPEGSRPWLPQPDGWGSLTVEAQFKDSNSTLNLYRKALRLRRTRSDLGDGTMEWLEAPAGVLHLRRGPRFACLVNVEADPVELPSGARPIVSSEPLVAARLPAGAAVWLTH